MTEEDTRLWKLNENVGDLFDGSHLDLMGRRQTHRRSLKYLREYSSILADANHVATLDEKDRAMLQLLAAREVREDQLVAADAQWREARRLARDRSGETAAEELQERLYIILHGDYSQLPAKITQNTQYLNCSEQIINPHFRIGNQREEFLKIAHYMNDLCERFNSQADLLFNDCDKYAFPNFSNSEVDQLFPQVTQPFPGRQI